MEDEEGLKQASEEADEEARKEADEEGEAPKHARNEVDRKWEKSITVLHKITSEHDEDSITHASDGVEKDAGTINILVQQALKEAFISWGDSDLKDFIRESLKQVVEYRVLYVLALRTPITLLIARTVRGDYDRYSDKIMIRNLVVEMIFSFIAVTVCHLYIIIFHFVHTVAPRLSMRCGFG
ncbi:hypothetical protein GQ55_6G187000 [Panicum hallii var. hallii]|uniref:Uncharacterized protein n=1 Tax=Panicum hallii var. hallii TaxID=1504633 RepID=A0A2T7D778_9POAL|nr:hypothetical protein GQ55_6G187000 [Panicum hallii var. hallii]